MLRLPHSLEKHLDKSVSGAGLGAMEQAEEKGMPFTRLPDIPHIADFQRSCFGGKLSDFRMGDTFQKRLRVKDGVQPFQMGGPLSDVFQFGRPRHFLEVGKPGQPVIR
jgi:hypothetical protein